MAGPHGGLVEPLVSEVQAAYQRCQHPIPWVQDTMQVWVRHLLLSFAILVRSFNFSVSLASLRVVTQITLHFILQTTHESYGRATSLSALTSHLTGSSNKVVGDDDDYYNPTPATTNPNGTLAVDRRANATFVILTRNREIDAAIRSVREIEDRFNKNFGYPYVFLNEEPFPEEFKRLRSPDSLVSR